MSDANKNAQRIATLERQLSRHIKFSQDTQKHVPVLMSPDDYPASLWREAVAWWAQCNEKAVLSEQ